VGCCVGCCVSFAQSEMMTRHWLVRYILSVCYPSDLEGVLVTVIGFVGLVTVVARSSRCEIVLPRGRSDSSVTVQSGDCPLLLM
jgi:hypothetical protein